MSLRSSSGSRKKRGIEGSLESIFERVSIQYRYIAR